MQLFPCQLFQVPASEEYVSDDIAFPANWFKELQVLAALYGARVEFVPQVTWFAGRYNKETKTCFINAPYEDCELFPTDYVIKTFCHELAHHVQHEIISETKKLKEILAFEQEACDMAHELARHYFPDLYVPKQTYLDSFVTKDNLRDFGNYHGCAEADIEETVKQFEPVKSMKDSDAIVELDVKVQYERFL